MSSTDNYANPNVDQTVKIFDKFYQYEVSVPQGEYDAVYSFMRSVFGTGEAAANFTVSVFRISEDSQIPVMELLQDFQGQNAIQLTATLAYYLNNLRSASTLLGINVTAVPNYYVARNVRQ
jgi:pyruvate/2-oxoacid:ferredoxin oxidoreductase alpha subunit